MSSYSDISPDSPELIENPYPYYRWLRDESPAHYDSKGQQYLISRFADVQAIALDWKAFSSELPGKEHDHFASMDPPRHDVHRASVARLFTPGRVKSLEEYIRQLCGAIFAPASQREVFDIAQEYASVIPSQVITRIVGLPAHLQEPFRRQALAITELTGGPEVYDAIGVLQGLTRAAIADRPALPKDGILYGLLDSQSSDGLSERDVVGICTNLVLAGTDTASNVITSALVLLDEQPAVRASLMTNPGQIPAFVEEALRLESPVQWLTRITRDTVRLHDQVLPAGSVLRLYWGSANRDGTVFTAPDEIDLQRASRHLAFGHGLHFCVGAALARLEVRVAIETVLAEAPSYQLPEEGRRRVQSSMFRGYEHLPFRADRRAAIRRSAASTANW